MVSEKGYNIGFLVLVIGLLSLTLFFGCIKPPEPNEPIGVPTTKFAELPKFSSCAAIAAEFEKNKDSYGGYYEKGLPTIMPMMTAGASEGATDSSSAPAPTDYSTTNVQVEGVDEADFVKTDGNYIYTISNGMLHVVKAFPAEEATELSATEFKDLYPQEMFIDGDKLLVFGQGTKYDGQSSYKSGKYDPYYYGGSMTAIQLWDISDKKNPKKIRTIEFEGDYVSSRKIGNVAYFVIREQKYYSEDEDPEYIVPLYKEESAKVKMKNYTPMADCIDVGYLPPVQAKSFIIVGSISMKDAEIPITKEVIVASGDNIFASLSNLYVAEDQYVEAWTPWSGKPYDLYGPTESEEKTIVHKFALSGQNISYIGYMGAPGYILNQFSMDEYNGYFRIATTRGHVSRWGEEDKPAMNNIYTFQSNLSPAGKLEDLAPGEKIYSARFMGERAYLVTFKKVDPLFVIDLTDPTKPTVLGKLKIPGYSDYLHPIDKDHIIGLGKETVEAEEGTFAWYQGIKMAVFDVSDVEHPKEMHKVVIGDRGTDSYALDDHKAFLYDKKKNLLVIPVLLAEIDEKQYDNSFKEMPANTYGDYTFQGAYVFDLTLENGFKLKGTITHVDDKSSFLKSGYYYYDDGNLVKRSLYIDDVLYTISDNKVLANSLSDLSEVAKVNLTTN